MTGDVVVIHLRRDVDGRVRVVADVDTATEVACQLAAGAHVRLFVGELVGAVPEWVRTLARCRPSAVVLVGDADTAALAALLGRRIAPVAVAYCTSCELRAVLAKTTSRTPVAGASPYGSGVLPVIHAEAAGIRASDPCRALAELDRIAAETLVPLEVPVRCDEGAVAGLWGQDGPWSHGVQERRLALDRSGVRLCPVIPIDEMSIAVTLGLARACVDNIIVTADLDAGTDRRLRSAVATATAAGIGCSFSVALSASGDPTREAESVAAAIRAVPDLRLEIDEDYLESLAALGAFVGALPHAAAPVLVRHTRRTRRQRVERSMSGDYLETPLSHGIHDLWWEHSDAVSHHAEWLADVMATGGCILVPDRSQADPSVAHVAMVDVPRAAAIVGWSEVAGRDDPLPAVPVVRTEDDRNALLDAVDLAWHGGDLGGLLFAAGLTIGSTCRVGVGPCPAYRGRALHVDRAFMVRTGWSGPVLGEVGTLWEDLRSALRTLAGPGCACLPVGWADRSRPWTGRVLDAAAAVRQRAAPGDAIRVSGLGGPLHHQRGSSASWPDGVVLVQHGQDEHVLWSRWSDAAAPLSSPMAAIVEAHLDLGPDAADHLRSRGMPPSAVLPALAGAADVLARLSGHVQSMTNSRREAS